MTCEQMRIVASRRLVESTRAERLAMAGHWLTCETCRDWFASPARPRFGEFATGVRMGLEDALDPEARTIVLGKGKERPS